MTDKHPVLFGEVLFDCFEEDGSRVLGGAPFNVAWHLQGFGLKPVFISRVGDDPPGRDIRAIMQQWKMNASGLQTDAVHSTGEVTISLRDGQPTFHILESRAYDYIDAASIPPLSPALLYHGSLGLRQEASARALEELITHYHPPVFLDVNLRSPWWKKNRVLELLARTNWLKINDDELMALTDGRGSLVDQARLLQERYDIDLVIVTEGAEGAMSLDKNGKTHRVRPKGVTTVVDTVGAGDAFAAVCILGLINAWGLPQMLHRAQSFASLIVAQRGAIIDDPAVYQRLVAKWSPGS